jgi:glycosyltransferase involved in cell wall biosynthesis
MISIIVPCYNEAAALPHFYPEVKRVLEQIGESYEILFVNDGSKDNTLEEIRSYAQQDERVQYLSFSRNFGKEAAIYAGFCNARGDYIAVMDADMQDPPSLLPRMLEILKSGEYDSVATRRVNRAGEPPIRSWFARRFYSLIHKISDTDIVDGARDFRLMKRPMVDAIVNMGEYNRFSKGIFGWVGFKTYWLPFENVERVAGETKWNFWKLFQYAIDGIINFSQAPLDIASWFGIAMTGFSFVALIAIIVRKILFGDPVAGWASTVCIILFIGGLQMFCIGIMGQYVAKTYLEAKKRPHYIISESNRKDVIKIR